MPQTKQNLAKVDDGLCKFLYQVKLYTDSLYLKCMNLNTALNSKDEDIKELKIIVGRKVEKIKELQNTETSIDLSNKSNTVEQQQQNIKIKDKLLNEKDELIKEWRQKFHVADKSLIRWKVMFICAVLMLIAEIVILYDHIQSMTMIKVWNRCKLVAPI